MSKKYPEKEARKQGRLEILRSNVPRCCMCGEADWRCLERHHVADFGRDKSTVVTCRNCHRKVSDDQKDHPAFDPNADPALDVIGHFLLGLADMLRIIVEKLIEFGHILIALGAARPGTEQAT